MTPRAARDGVAKSNNWHMPTDRPAFAGTGLMFRELCLRPCPGGANTTLRLVDGMPGTVYSAQEMRIGNKRADKAHTCFERVDDTRGVYRLMRDIQQGAA